MFIVYRLNYFFIQHFTIQNNGLPESKKNTTKLNLVLTGDKLGLTQNREISSKK